MSFEMKGLMLSLYSCTVGANKTQYPCNVPAPPPNIVPALPPEVRVHCPRTTPRPGGSTGTMSPHCPRGYCGDNVPALPTMEARDWLSLISWSLIGLPRG